MWKEMEMEISSVIKYLKEPLKMQDEVARREWESRGPGQQAAGVWSQQVCLPQGSHCSAW